MNNVIYIIKKLQLFDKFKAQLKEEFRIKLFILIINIIFKTYYLLIT